MTPLHVLLKRRKALNVCSTPAEQQLVSTLRENKLTVRQQVIVGPYIVDLLVPKKMLIIEVDGAVHDDPAVRERDAHRTAYLVGLGFDLIRVRNGKVKDKQTIQRVMGYPDRASRKAYLRITRALMQRRNFPDGPLIV